MNRSEQVQTPVTLLRSILDKYPFERYKHLNPPGYELNSTTAILLEGWLWHEVLYAIKQRNQINSIQIAGAVGYADCISSEG